MDVLEAHLFAVEFTYPYRYEAKNHSGETVPMLTNRNEQRHIFCATAERAIALIHAQHDDATIHVVRKVGARRPVIIDPELEHPSLGETGDTT